jgi:hypothetical protein
MFILSDVLTYMRRIIKTPVNTQITDELLIDYVNRFWISDVDARIQLFDLKTKYQFMTTPGVDQYNMPLYNYQYENPLTLASTIGLYPVYQGFFSPAYINGIDVGLHTQKNSFYNIWPNIVQNLPVVKVGDGTATYNIQLPILPFVPPPNPPINALLRGHVDMAGIISLATAQSNSYQDPPVTPQFLTSIPVTSVEARVFISSIAADGSNILVTDSGQFLEGNQNYGLLMSPGTAPFGNQGLVGPLTPNYSTTQNTINYVTGTINVTFPQAIPPGHNINVQCFYFQSGLPRGILFYNNTLVLRSVPSSQYLVEIDAYYSPAALLNSAAAIPYGYMSEYIARGAARKILSDTGDKEQLEFYEPMFREQEMLVWKRSQRQFTATRTQTIYSQGLDQGVQGNTNSMGGGGGTI